MQCAQETHTLQPNMLPYMSTTFCLKNGHLLKASARATPMPTVTYATS